MHGWFLSHYYVFMVGKLNATIVIQTTTYLDVTFQDGGRKAQTILNQTWSTCKRRERYVQNWKYFRFVVASLKDRLAINSNSIDLASMSSTIP